MEPIEKLVPLTEEEKDKLDEELKREQAIGILDAMAKSKKPSPKTKVEKPKLPVVKQEEKEIPTNEPNNILEVPPNYNPDNTIFIKGTPVEIKPTKLLYFRNGATDCFGAIRAIPITELMVLPKNVIDKDYSGDELVYRFLYAVFDGNPLFKKNYNYLTAGDIEKCIDIFGRLNGIFAREEEAKKKKAEQQQMKP